jgi:hypothetical protein
MVSSLFVDTLRDPTSTLLDLYDTCDTRHDFPAVVSKYFARIFERPDAYQEVCLMILMDRVLYHALFLINISARYPGCASGGPQRHTKIDL